MGEKLHLHLPKTYTEEVYGKLLKVIYVANSDYIYETFQDTAKKFDIPFHLNFAKRSGTGGINEWQHEPLSRKPICNLTSPF